MPLVGLGALLGAVPLYQWGPRQFLNALLVGLVAGILTILLFRLHVWHKVRRLVEEKEASHWQWACITRIRLGEQLVFGPGVRPIFRGPVGTLAADADRLVFTPDRLCRRRGYVQRTWNVSEVVVVKQVSRRDISGLAYQDVDMLLGGHQVRVFVISEVGQRPRSLLPEQPQV